jgi:cellulose synthase/poly-beta-1,6-N-acetylglucosamine synthase-like glycosyltransferase
MRAVRRLGKVHRLLGSHDRLLAVEAELAALRHELRHLRDRPAVDVHGPLAPVVERLDAVREHCARLESNGAYLGARISHTWDQLDLLKSKLEIPAERFEEFQARRARQVIPQKPLVTVCVATYNRSRLLVQRCLKSILRQTYRHFEVIVVGDGCTDGTADAVAKLRDSRVRFVNLPQRGDYPTEPLRRWMVAGTAPLNRALALAGGDYVTHLDDDDEHLPDRLEKLTLFAAANDCDLVWHPFWCEDADGSWRVVESPELRLGMVTTSSMFYRSWIKDVFWDVQAHLLAEPGDWNRMRRIKYLGAAALRYPEPLLRHYRERSQAKA